MRLAITLNAKVLVCPGFVENKGAAVKANITRSIQRRKLTRVSSSGSYGAVDVNAGSTRKVGNCAASGSSKCAIKQNNRTSSSRVNRKSRSNTSSKTRNTCANWKAGTATKRAAARSAECAAVNNKRSSRANIYSKGRSNIGSQTGNTRANR